MDNRDNGADATGLLARSDQKEFAASNRAGIWMGFAFLLLAFTVGLSVSLNGFPVSSANEPAIAADDPASELRIKNVPFEEKLPDFGGEACVTMYLKALGQNVDQDVVFDAAAVDPLLGRGCHTPELVVACKKIGFETGPVSYICTNQNREQLYDQTWKEIVKGISDGVGSVFCWHNEQGVEQFVLVIGVDTNRGLIIYHDPNRADGAEKTIARDRFFQRCELDTKSQNGNWQKTFIRIDLNHQHRPTVDLRPAKTKTDADFARHIRKLKKQLPNKDFNFVIQKPFVVVGDEKPDVVRKRADGTVKWAVNRLKQDYFSRDPFEIIDVWLFRDKASYEKHNKLLWNDEPGTPFGFYSSQRQVLVMNISTGGGTLVHEIVHPFMESNFVACPSWFNEGLASLYEQSSTRDGHIIGLTNWRLRGLQGAIEANRVPTFKELCSTTTREFYNDESGRNYAQARYLCYYLQEQGKLVEYYHEFVKNAEEDPTGYDTLVRILGNPDMNQFKKHWEQYVMKLRFP